MDGEAEDLPIQPIREKHSQTTPIGWFMRGPVTAGYPRMFPFGFNFILHSTSPKPNGPVSVCKVMI